MHKIHKGFECCIGHRVWNQTLNKEAAGDIPCRCRFLHGHQISIIVELSSSTLHNEMVTDFHHLNWFKHWVDENIDHKFLIDINDPLLPTLLHSDKKEFNVVKKSLDLKVESGFKPALSYLKILTGPIIRHDLISLNKFRVLRDEIVFSEADASYLEMLEGLVITSFVPTSENLSRAFYLLIKQKMEEFNLGVNISSVTFKESPKTGATYTEV